MKRLAVYDELRKMHAILKAIQERSDDWEQNAIEAVAHVLYLAESVFACSEDDYYPGGVSDDTVMSYDEVNKMKLPRSELVNTVDIVDIVDYCGPTKTIKLKVRSPKRRVARNANKSKTRK